MAKPISPKITLTLIIAVFVLPFIAASVTFWYYKNNNFNTTNRGQLVIPPFNVDKVAVNVAQKTITLAELTGDEDIRHRWLLIYLAPSNCDEACNTTDFYLNQLQTALGKNSPHLFPLMIQPEQPTAMPEKPFPNVTYAQIQTDTASKLIARLPEANRPSAKGGIYLVDPHGYLMMYYPAEDDAGKILKDLQKLVKG